MIWIDGSYECAGTIIDEYWIVSAAHCFGNPEATGKITTIVAGATELDDLSNAQEREVAEVINHPDYVRDEYDITLIRLCEPLNLNGSTVVAINYATPATVSEADIAPGTQAFIQGWGASEMESPTNHLRGIDIPLISNDDAQITLDINNCNITLTDNHIVVYEENSGKAAGSRDSGSGLIVDINNEKILLGVDFTGCMPISDNPSVYTNVRALFGFIDQHVNMPIVDADEFILSDITISPPIGYQGDLIVQNGAKLTINTPSNLSLKSICFAEGKKLIVESGGEVIIGNHTILTSLCDNRNWAGVEINSGGILTIGGNSTTQYPIIEKAEIGIEAKSGSNLNIKNSILQNNDICILNRGSNPVVDNYIGCVFQDSRIGYSAIASPLTSFFTFLGSNSEGATFKSLEKGIVLNSGFPFNNGSVQLAITSCTFSDISDVGIEVFRNGNAIVNDCDFSHTGASQAGKDLACRVNRGHLYMENSTIDQSNGFEFNNSQTFSLIYDNPSISVEGKLFDLNNSFVRILKNPLLVVQGTGYAVRANRGNYWIKENVFRTHSGKSAFQFNSCSFSLRENPSIVNLNNQLGLSPYINITNSQNRGIIRRNNIFDNHPETISSLNSAMNMVYRCNDIVNPLGTALLIDDFSEDPTILANKFTSDIDMILDSRVRDHVHYGNRFVGGEVESRLTISEAAQSIFLVNDDDDNSCGNPDFLPFCNDLDLFQPNYLECGIACDPPIPFSGGGGNSLTDDINCSYLQQLDSLTTVDTLKDKALIEILNVYFALSDSLYRNDTIPSCYGDYLDTTRFCGLKELFNAYQVFADIQYHDTSLLGPIQVQSTLIQSTVNDFIDLDSLQQVQSFQTFLTSINSQSQNQTSLLEVYEIQKDSLLVSQFDILKATNCQNEPILEFYIQSFKHFINPDEGSRSNTDTLAIENISDLCPYEFGSSVHLARAVSSQWNYVPNENCSSSTNNRFRAPEDFENDLVIIPNPASNLIQIEFEKDNGGKLTIFNSIGQIIYSNISYQTNSEIDISSWEQGVYFVVLELPDKSRTLKFVKQ